MFFGEFIMAIDKNRVVSIPAQFLSALHREKSGELFMFEGMDESILVISSIAWESILDKLIKCSFSNINTLKVLRLYYSMLEAVYVDKRGRIRIPERFMKYARLEDKISFIGIGECFEVWNPDIFRAIDNENKKSFICYSHKDGDFVNKLEIELLSHGRKKPLIRYEMDAGRDIFGLINQKAIYSNFFIVLSPDSVSNNWSKRQLNAMLMEEFSRRSIRIIPLLYRDCSIPGYLKEKIYIDFRKAAYNEGIRQFLDCIPSSNDMYLAVEKLNSFMDI